MRLEMIRKKGRYWVFGFDGYYPSGGMNDYRFSFNTIEEFEMEIAEIGTKYQHYQILDTESHYHFQADFGTVVKWVCKNVGGECYE